MSMLHARLPADFSAPVRYDGPERRRFADPVRDVAVPGEPSTRFRPAPTEDTGPHDDRCQVVDEVQEAVCAAMSGEAPLFDLIKRRVLIHCARRPEVGVAAAAELERLLAVDIVQRHFHACHKRRRLQRELADLAVSLRAGAGLD